MAFPALIGAIISTVVTAVSAGVGAAIRSGEQKQQADQIQRNIRQIHNMVNQGEIDLEEALERIDTMVANTTGKLRTALEQNMNAASKKIRNQYESALKTSMENIRTQYTQRRLTGEPLAEVEAKTGATLQEQAGEQISNLRERALSLISGQIAELELKGAQEKESKLAEFQNFRNTGLAEIMRLQNMANTLERESRQSIGLAIPSLATGIPLAAGAQGGQALGELASSFITAFQTSPQETAKIEPTEFEAIGGPSNIQTEEYYVPGGATVYNISKRRK